MREPIANILTGNRLAIASFQDTIMSIMYDSVDPSAILYGGTAIWRCYDGSKFAEDIDIYYSKPTFLDSFQDVLKRHSMRIVDYDPEIPSRCRVTDDRNTVLVKASEGSGESIIRQYARVDGTTMMISVLSPVELMVRKIEAYEGRRYIRDIYDIMQLTNFLDKKDHMVSSRLRLFLKNIKKPIDEKVLSTLIYQGTRDVNFRQITEYLKRWLGEV